MTEARSHIKSREQYVQISKIGAGYVYRAGTDYRCKDCWKFIAKTGECSEIEPSKEIKPEGYCILWSEGKPAYAAGLHSGNYTPEEVGYGEDPNGTLCRRCKHFDGSSRCEIVKGEIKFGACCDNQEPKL